MPAHSLCLELKTPPDAVQLPAFAAELEPTGLDSSLYNKTPTVNATTDNPKTITQRLALDSTCAVLSWLSFIL